MHNTETEHCEKKKKTELRRRIELRLTPLKATTQIPVRLAIKRAKPSRGPVPNPTPQRVRRRTKITPAGGGTIKKPNIKQRTPT